MSSSTSTRRTTEYVLETHQYRRVFDVLAACDSATNLSQFRELVVDSIARAYRVASTTFFVGSTTQAACADPDPVILGSTKGMLPEYQENWYRYDIFAAEETRSQFNTSRVATLAEITNLSSEPRHYVADYLFRHDVRSATAVCLDLAGGRRALIGLFDRDPHRVGAGELASLRLLAAPLSRIAQTLPDAAVTAVSMSTLSPRQAEVARLVAQGLSNHDIAVLLTLHEDSIKKYVSRILAELGCRNRTELALMVRASEG